MRNPIREYRSKIHNNFQPRWINISIKGKTGQILYVRFFFNNQLADD